MSAPINRIPLCMRTAATVLTASLCLSAAAALASQAEQITFDTADGITIYGEIYRADAAASAPTILLFHQGGGNSAEYEPLAPRLNAAGYHAIAIDQRSGGDLFGRSNRSAAEVSPEAGYCDAYPDLEATLLEARRRGFTGPIVAWGSSYSAALVVQLAAKHPNEVSAVVALSPASGDSMDGCRPEPWAERMNQPLLVARPSGELEIDTVRQQYDWFADRGAITVTAVDGRHGSSMLVPERNEAPTDAAWAAVMEFLRRHAGAGGS